MMIEQVGNPKGLKPMTPGNLEWSNPEVPDECDDEPESNKRTEAILSHISTEATEFIDHTTIRPLITTPKDIATDRPQHQSTIETEYRTEGETVVCEPKKKRKKPQ